MRLCRMRLCRLLVRGAVCVRLASFGLGHARPTLFLANVESRLSPILGIPDVYFAAKPPRRQRHHLFLIRHKADWPRAWDSLINKCHHDLEHDEDDDT